MRSLYFALLATTLLATPALAQITPQTSQAAGQAVQAAPAATSFGLGKVFDEADTNRDNVVTKEEFMAKAERHFGMADTNKDGKITREEMQTQQNAVMQQMQQNLFGKGNGWQGKINDFMNNSGITPQAAPTTPVVISPSAPVVNPPTAPVTPSSSY